MNLIEKVHGSYIHGRRVAVLACKLTGHLPNSGKILDVGCGDGLLASLIQRNKPALAVTGIDVLVREHTHIPTQQFDGKIMPFPDDSFDSVIFVDVLHHTEDPMVLLGEACRVSRGSVVIKDHTKNGFLAEQTLRFMDQVGNCRHNVALPHNYWPKAKWLSAFDELRLSLRAWNPSLGLYPPPLSWLFDRSLHFIAHAEVQRR